MILAIDIGNTNITLGFIDNGNILHIVRTHTDSDSTSTDYAIRLRQIFEIYGIDSALINGAIICSSVPSVALSIKTGIRKLLGIEAMIVGAGTKTGMKLRIDDPSTLGPDLVTGSVAGIEYYGAPVIIVDLGTATTVFAVDSKGVFRGGAILPGVKLSYKALAAGTSLLPEISITAPKKVVSTNTVDCMRSGAVFGNAAMLDGMIERMEEELEEKCTVVATGGISQYIIPYCRRKDIIYDGDLILKGLWVLYNKNKRA